MAFVVLKMVWNLNGYLLDVSQICKCSSPWNVKASAARSCHGSPGTSLGSMGYVACIALYWVQMMHCFT